MLTTLPVVCASCLPLIPTGVYQAHLSYHRCIPGTPLIPPVYKGHLSYPQVYKGHLSYPRVIPGFPTLKPEESDGGRFPYETGLFLVVLSWKNHCFTLFSMIQGGITFSKPYETGFKPGYNPLGCVISVLYSRVGLFPFLWFVPLPYWFYRGFCPVSGGLFPFHCWLMFPGCVKEAHNPLCSELKVHILLKTVTFSD